MRKSLIKGCLFDADGVLYRGSEPIEGGPEAIRQLREKGIRVGVVTNNSTRDRKSLLEKLRRLGYDFEDAEILSSAMMAADFIASERSNASVFVIGERGLINELRNKDLQIVVSEDENVDYVVVGLDRQCTYEKLRIAMKHIMDGAKFIATNTDTTLPQANGSFIPGAGALIAALRAAAGKEPDLICGKPSAFLYLRMLEKLNLKKEEVLFVGDRVETDIKGSIVAGIQPILVLTGVVTQGTTKQILAENGIDPNSVIILPSIKELISLDPIVSLTDHT